MTEKPLGAAQKLTAPARTRSPGYPYIGLEEAIGRAKSVWDHEKRNAAPIEALASHWGLNAKSSSTQLVLSALKKFGLLQELVQGKDRLFKLSDAALNILLHEQADSPERIALLKQCALRPKIHADLWKEFNGDLPSDATLRRKLIIEREFNANIVDDFIKEFRDTITFANLSQSDKITTIGSGDVEQESETSSQVISSGKSQQVEKTVPIQGSDSGTSSARATMSVLREFSFPLSVGVAALKVPYPMGEDDFEFFMDTLKLWKKKLVQTAMPARQFPALATWKNKDCNKPIKIMREMGTQNGVRYFQSEDGTGIPESELTFDA